MSGPRRIAIVGAESTGKSWLVTALAEVLRARGQTVHTVPETLRLWCEREGRTPLAHEQAAIAQAQAEAVLACTGGTVLADTTPLMTAVYSEHFFGDAQLTADALAHQRLYSHTLVTGLDLPATLFADMGGALMTSEAVLQAVLVQRAKGKGSVQSVALSDAAAWLALPRHWGLTQPQGAVGGAHAGYRVYPCKDGRVAVAALEPHFAARLCEAAGIAMKGMATMMLPATHKAVARFVAGKTRRELDQLASERDIPLHTLA